MYDIVLQSMCMYIGKLQSNQCFTPVHKRPY